MSSGARQFSGMFFCSGLGSLHIAQAGVAPEGFFLGAVEQPQGSSMRRGSACGEQAKACLPSAMNFQLCSNMTAWTPKVCKTMAQYLRTWPQRLLFDILLGSRWTSRLPVAAVDISWMALGSHICSCLPRRSRA